MDERTGRAPQQYGLADLDNADRLMSSGVELEAAGRIRPAIAAYLDAERLRYNQLGPANPSVAETNFAICQAAGTEAPELAVWAAKRTLHSDGAWLLTDPARRLDGHARRAEVIRLSRHADSYLSLVTGARGTLGGSSGPEAVEVKWVSDLVSVAVWRRRLPLILATAYSPAFGDPELYRQYRAALSASESAVARKSAPREPGPHVEVDFRSFMRYIHDGRNARAILDSAESALLKDRPPLTDDLVAPFSAWPLAALSGTVGPAGRFLVVLRVANQETTSYIAFNVAPDERPQFVHLGPAGPIDQAALSIVESMGPIGLVRGLDQGFEASDSSTPEKPNDASLAEIGRLVLDRLAPLIDSEGPTVLAVDGPLRSVPFGTSPAGDNTQGIRVGGMEPSFIELVDGVAFQPRSHAGSVQHDGEIVLITAPDYDLGMPAEDPLKSDDRFFGPLPGAAAEGDVIAQLLPEAKHIHGPGATRAALAAIEQPRILHLATHGYAAVRFSTDSYGGLIGPKGSYVRLDGPLSLLSRGSHQVGIALAGANVWLADRPIPDEIGVPLLSVGDVAGLSLLGTDLVVLSACETGLGSDTSVCGAPGTLCSAFLLAGARSVVASRWKVVDEDTLFLMTTFYEELLSGRTKAEALREAKHALRVEGAHWSSWAAFALWGDPGSLATI